MKKPELMCPIRDWASLEACKQYADAVYFGVSELNMRAASGIETGEIDSFVKKAHSYGLKAYLTVNSVIYNPDIEKAEKLVKKAKKAGVDAVIVWDPAVIEIAKKNKVPFIVSTQANVSNWKSAEFYKSLGAKRIVLAREMTLNQIKELKKKVNIEIEAFVHGAMCMAISGRCILSAYLYDKSSNCGSCAQPCRKEWTLIDDEGHKISNEGQYFMSAKDMNMIEFVPELIKAGIDSFKIEGRRRDPKYIEVTSRCYREAIDSYFDKTFDDKKVERWMEELSTVYNRGFSTGFYFGTPGKEGISYDKADNVSSVRKMLVGYVTHYYPKVKSGAVSLNHLNLKVGERIIIEGEHTFIEQDVTSIQIDNKDVKMGKKGEEVAVVFNDIVRKNDKVFLIKKREV
ncbi:MAG: peptidase U32 family protein [Candidatus Paceibacterota bacterium]|jgi:putative protease